MVNKINTVIIHKSDGELKSDGMTMEMWLLFCVEIGACPKNGNG